MLQNYVLVVALVTVVLLIALSGLPLRRRRSDLAACLRAVSVLRLTQVRHELRMRTDEFYAQYYADAERPDRNMAFLLLLAEIKLQCFRVADQVADIRRAHHVEIAQLGLTYEQLLKTAMDENPYVPPLWSRATVEQRQLAQELHNKENERAARAQLQRNEQISEWLQIADVLVRNASDEAEQAYKDARGR